MPTARSATSRADGRYCSTVSDPAQGAPQVPSSAETQGVRSAPFAPCAEMRRVQVRRPVHRDRVSATVAAFAREPNGPSAPARGVRTTDSRGNGSSVSTTHQVRPGFFDRRL